MAIGGNSDSLSLYDVEVIDLLNSNSNCGFLADYPVEIASHTAAYIDGVIKSCGGTYYDVSESKYMSFANCYDYDPTNDEWTQSNSLLKPRIDMASSVLGNSWLVSGGTLLDSHDFNVPGYENDTELWSDGNFELGTAMLPEAMSDHCQVAINSTHIFFAYAYENGHAYILDYDADIWTQVEDIPIRFDEDGDGYRTTSCGLINNSANGAEVVLAGNGYTHILNLGTLEWKEGPHLLPEGYSYASAQLENTLVLAGGEAWSDPVMNTIRLFDSENYEWIELEQKMKLPRENFAIVAVPGDFVNCN